MQHNNNLQLPSRPVRSSNAGVNVKELFNVNGGSPHNNLYGTTAAINQAYEHVEEEDGNSIRLTPRNQTSWASNSASTQRL